MNQFFPWSGFLETLSVEDRRFTSESLFTSIFKLNTNTGQDIRMVWIGLNGTGQIHMINDFKIRPQHTGCPNIICIL